MNFAKPRRHPWSATRILITGALGVALIGGPGFALSPATPALKRATAAAALRDDVAAAKDKLSAVSDQVEAAEKAANSAAAKLPAANRAVTAAEAAERAAQQVQVAAEKTKAKAAARAQVARDAVTAKKAWLAQAHAQLEVLKTRIAGLARQQYISGGDSAELGILLDSEDLTAFSFQLQAMSRISRGNSISMAQVTRLRDELAAALAKLKALEQEAANREGEAEADANAAQASAGAAQAALVSATAATANVASLIGEREQAVTRALTLRRQIKATYEDLQAQLRAAQGISKSRGTGRDPKAAVDWAMKWVGSGSSYSGLCLAFVDDAYAASSGRVGTAIAQWNRAKAAGVGHPGDRNPPIGAQVFWLSGNPAKHVAIYAGGGMVITTGANGGTVSLVSMEYLDSYGPYLGWAEPYYGSGRRSA